MPWAMWQNILLRLVCRTSVVVEMRINHPTRQSSKLTQAFLCLSWKGLSISEWINWYQVTWIFLTITKEQKESLFWSNSIESILSQSLFKNIDMLHIHWNNKLYLSIQCSVHSNMAWDWMAYMIHFESMPHRRLFLMLLISQYGLLLFHWLSQFIDFPILFSPNQTRHTLEFLR